jgi:hypothetical protein
MGRQGCRLAISIARKHRRATAVWNFCIAALVLIPLTPLLTEAQIGESTLSPEELIRKTVANELAAADAPGHYMYRLTDETPSGSQTREVIETRNWLIGRVVLINGQPLHSERQNKETARLRKLLTDHSGLQSLRKRERHNEERVRRMLRALPDAFIYQYAGTNTEECGDLVRLKFRPNPNFEPSSRELRVYQGLEGTISVNARLDRLVRVEAALFRDVEFGRGILGRLYRGGTFLLEQRDVGSGRWAITTLALHFTGKVLLFKSIHIDSVRKATDFRRMSDNLTLEQGVELLIDPTKAEKSMPRNRRPSQALQGATYQMP